jgi:hypothetical protein
MALKKLILYLLVRLFILTLCLSLVTTIKAQGFIWIVISGFFMLISSGWLIYMASKVIEERYTYGVSLLTIACVVELLVAMFLFNDKAMGSILIYVFSCALSFIIVHNKVFYKNVF